MLDGEIDMCEHVERLWLRRTTAMVGNAFKICDLKSIYLKMVFTHRSPRHAHVHI